MVTAHALAASCSLLVYDYLTTFDQEVEYIWSSNSSSYRTGLFMSNRYSPFVDTILAIHLQCMPNQTVKRCHDEYTALTWLVTAGMIQSLGVFTLQTYALFQSTPFTRKVFFILGLLVAVSCIVLVQIKINTVKFSLHPGTGRCQFSAPDPVMVVPYIIILFFTIVMFALTLISAVRQRHTPLDWLKEIHICSISFYSLLLFVSVWNLVFALRSPASSVRMFASPLRVFTCVVCNRILLKLHAYRTCEEDEDAVAADSSPVLSSVFGDQSQFFHSAPSLNLSIYPQKRPSSIHLSTLTSLDTGRSTHFSIASNGS